MASPSREDTPRPQDQIPISEFDPAIQHFIQRERAIDSLAGTPPNLLQLVKTIVQYEILSGDSERADAARDLANKQRDERLDITYNFRLAKSELDGLSTHSKREYKKTIQDVLRRAAETTQSLLWFMPGCFWEIEHIFTTEKKRELGIEPTKISRSLHFLAALPLIPRVEKVWDEQFTANELYNAMIDSGQSSIEVDRTIRRVELQVHRDEDNLEWFWGNREGNVERLLAIRMLPNDKDPVATIFHFKITYDEVAQMCSKQRMAEIVELIRSHVADKGLMAANVAFFENPPSIDIFGKRRKIIRSSELDAMSKNELKEMLQVLLKEREMTDDNGITNSSTDEEALDNIALLKGLRTDDGDVDEPQGWFYLPENLRLFLTPDLPFVIPECPIEPQCRDAHQISIVKGVVMHTAKTQGGRLPMTSVKVTGREIGTLKRIDHRGRPITNDDVLTWLTDKETFAKQMIEDFNAQQSSYIKELHDVVVPAWRQDRVMWEINLFIVAKEHMAKVTWSTKADIDAIRTATKESLIATIDHTVTPPYIQDLLVDKKEKVGKGKK